MRHALLVGALMAAPWPVWAQGGGSYQPPIHSTNTDSSYASGVGMLALAGPVTLGGAFGVTGFGFGDDPFPLLGMEVMASGLVGSGDFSQQNFQLDVSMLIFNTSFIFKMKPLEERNNGIVGLTLYAGPQLGSLTLGLTNEHGTVTQGSFLFGGSAGGVLTLRLGGYLTLIGFGGVQHLQIFGPENSSGLTIPSFGGNAKIHLTPNWSIDLGSTLNQFEELAGGGGKDRVKLFILGVSWNDRSGTRLVQEGIWP